MKSFKMLAAMVLVAAVALGWAFSTHSQAQEKDKGLLYHVVSFKFKEGAKPEDIKKVEDAFAALPGKIKQIDSLSWGTNVSPEKLNKGFTHCWVLTFKSDKDRDEYLVHPDHKEFGKSLGGVLGDVFVIDFWGKK